MRWNRLESIEVLPSVTTQANAPACSSGAFGRSPRTPYTRIPARTAAVTVPRPSGMHREAARERPGATQSAQFRAQTPAMHDAGTRIGAETVTQFGRPLHPPERQVGAHTDRNRAYLILHAERARRVAGGPA